MKPVIVVGAGHAAAAASRALRANGFDGSVLVIGAEPHLPYRRPLLSQGYLTGQTATGDLWLLTDGWCTDNDVEVRPGSPAQAVHGTQRAVELADGATLYADALLVATGGRPRQLPNVAGEQVRYLRTLAGAGLLRADLRPGAWVVVVGSGLIGSEVASTATELGAQVTVLGRSDRPLGHVLGARMGDVCAALQRTHGIDLRIGQAIRDYRETPTAAIITTGDGHGLEADVVVATADMVPDTDVLAGSGITLGDGVIVDEYWRSPSTAAATSPPPGS